MADELERLRAENLKLKGRIEALEKVSKVLCDANFMRL